MCRGHLPPSGVDHDHIRNKAFQPQNGGVRSTRHADLVSFLLQDLYQFKKFSVVAKDQNFAVVVLASLGLKHVHRLSYAEIANEHKNLLLTAHDYDRITCERRKQRTKEHGVRFFWRSSRNGWDNSGPFGIAKAVVSGSVHRFFAQLIALCQSKQVPNRPAATLVLLDMECLTRK